VYGKFGSENVKEVHHLGDLVGEAILKLIPNNMKI
jgi:hypothetical protein